MLVQASCRFDDEITRNMMNIPVMDQSHFIFQESEQ